MHLFRFILLGFCCIASFAGAMKFKIRIILLCILLSYELNAQTITGSLSLLPNQEIRLEGINGFKNHNIATGRIQANGSFTLRYTPSDMGMGYLISSDKKPLFVVLCGEDIELAGEALSKPETITITKGKQNQWFKQYAQEQPRREQALSAWIYLENLYAADSLFSPHKKALQTIRSEKKHLKEEEAKFLSALPEDSYVRWFLPTRNLVSSVSTIAQYRTEEIPATIAAFRALDYTDERLYKSGLFKDAIESHFWLLENCGKPLDSVFVEMKRSIDAMLVHLVLDQKKLNEVTHYMFDLLERHSLFEASEYLALKVLNDASCTINSDLAGQLESYRAMKKGNTAPDINFGAQTYVNGMRQTQFPALSGLETPYTLIFFGASWCPKCQEELPTAAAQYAKWRNAGLEVVYISLDTDTTAFEQTVKNYPFFTYCDFKKWESSVVKEYYVFGTPTFFLLNNKREILLRPNSISQVDAWVDWFLIQGNPLNK
ncbi:MAG: TlpA family protein disulfide reductase [Bacteroidota bacterium]